jgi:dienelactone hydrolase
MDAETSALTIAISGKQYHRDMSVTTRAVEHSQDGQTFDSFLAIDQARGPKQPLVLVFHAWNGRSSEQEDFAKRLTAFGYAGLAVDLYGKGKRGETTEECQALMMPLVQDRALLRKRLLGVLEVAQGLPDIDASRIGAIGFCFGGLCALDLARAGAAIRGAASFHGLFTPPGLPEAKIQAKIIAFHGWDDPFAPPDQVTAFGQEMTAAGADWQLHAYGGTVHGFMSESANNPQMGIVYRAKAAGRAWSELQLFLKEAFSG